MKRVEQKRTERGIERLDGPGVEAVRRCGLPALLEAVDPGRFGTTGANLQILEGLALSLDLAAAGHAEMVAQISQPAADGGLELEPLTVEQRRLAGCFFLRVATVEAREVMSRVAEPAEVEGELEPDGLIELAESDPERMAERMARLITEFLRREREQPKAEPIDDSARAARAIDVFLTLLARAVGSELRQGRLKRLCQLAAERELIVGDRRWRGLEPAGELTTTGAAALLPISPDDIVGNEEYIDAGLRLARDVAGYDFAARRNPKRLNPILFGLGRPGCGKTIVAHAIGRTFLDHCAAHGIPARFAVIRKSDWASSYQNASAANLIRIFQELHRFEGVTGVYWPDIDTALASRDQTGLRSEEKANLSAAFGVFDGTLIPFDGKWFMICDANNLEMDEALRTRIAKNPHLVRGPESPSDYVRLLRDILLSGFDELIVGEQEQWTAIGEIARDGDISGRGIEGISRQIIDRIQDFEYPDEYYAADYEGRLRIIRECSRPVGIDEVKQAVERYVAFEKEEEERLARDRFERSVEDAVFGLNVQREVVRREAPLSLADIDPT
jgi:hypothetical protein